MKITLIDCGIIFSVANIMLAGLTIKEPLYEPLVCNPEKTAITPDMGKRCKDLVQTE
jgi:hypothetical protein